MTFATLFSFSTPSPWCLENLSLPYLTSGLNFPYLCIIRRMKTSNLQAIDGSVSLTGFRHMVVKSASVPFSLSLPLLFPNPLTFQLQLSLHCAVRRKPTPHPSLQSAGLTSSSENFQPSINTVTHLSLSLDVWNCYKSSMFCRPSLSQQPVSTLRDWVEFVLSLPGAVPIA